MRRLERGAAGGNKFALADEWLGEPLSGDAAEALATRYLGAFGPASAKDLERWSAVAGAKAVLDGMRDRLEVFVDERGRELSTWPARRRRRGCCRSSTTSSSPTTTARGSSPTSTARSSRRRTFA